MSIQTKSPVTVAELIVRLGKVPQDAVVFTEGCDCYGGASGAVEVSTPTRPIRGVPSFGDKTVVVIGRIADGES